MTTIFVDVYVEQTGKFLPKVPVLVRSDWVPNVVTDYNEVNADQLIRNEQGWYVFVYPADGFGHF